jgi:hypothetical protein
MLGLFAKLVEQVILIYRDWGLSRSHLTLALDSKNIFHR